MARFGVNLRVSVVVEMFHFPPIFNCNCKKNCMFFLQSAVFFTVRLGKPRPGPQRRTTDAILLTDDPKGPHRGAQGP